MASKILLQTNQNENTLQARDFLDSDALEIDEPLSECGSSVGSLTLTMTHPTELLMQTESSQDDFNTDLCLAEESDLHVGGGCDELDVISSQRSQPHSTSGAQLGHTTWTYYEEEYSQLRKAFHTLQTGFLEFLVLISKGADRKHAELLNVDSLLPKNCLSSFHKCLSPTESTASRAAGRCHRFDLLEFKLWKKHYCALLDAFDLVYKDCQLLGKLRGNRTEYELTAVHSGRALQSEFVTVFGQFMGRGSRATASLHCLPSGGFQVSSALLVELVAQCRVFRGELERLCATKDRLFYILKTAKEQRSKLKSYVTNLRADLRSLLAKMRQVEQGTGGPSSSLLLPSSLLPGDGRRALGPAERRDFQRRIDDLERVLKEEELRRKKLHNRLQELIGNIRVFCRVRPQTRSFLKTASEDKLVVLGDRLPDRLARPWAGQPGGRCFIFDRVFGPRATQPEVFEAVEELITSCVDGYNVCIMAYGQTGSGKTHTMMGSAREPGVNRRAICRLLASCGARPQWEYRLFLSMVEIYQEEVRDILTEGAVTASGSGGGMTAAVVPTPVRIMSSQDDEVTLHGLSEHRVRSEADIFRLFDRGERSRTVASTLLNMASSRSHLVVLLKVRGDSKIHLSSSVGTLTLCDLAGSENVTKSGATGERFSEATCINKSLTTLGRVFDALRNRQKPSYRETKLTYLLKPTLGGDSKCLLFVNVRCEPENAEETLRAIHFGINAMQVAPEKAQQRSKFRRTLGKISV